MPRINCCNKKKLKKNWYENWNYSEINLLKFDRNPQKKKLIEKKKRTGEKEKLRNPWYIPEFAQVFIHLPHIYPPLSLFLNRHGQRILTGEFRR